MSHGDHYQPPDHGKPAGEHDVIKGVILDLFGRHHRALAEYIAALVAEVHAKIDRWFAASDARSDKQTVILEHIAAAIARIEKKIDQPPVRHGRMVLLQPALTNLQGDPIVASYALKTDVVAHFVITLANVATGALDPVDPTDVFTVTSSDPTNLNAIIDKNAAGQTTLSVNWLHTTSPMLTGVSVSITDSAGNTADNAETFDMVPPTHVADQIGVDVAGVTETPQPVAV